MTGEYTYYRLKKMSPEELFCTLGIHRGKIGQKEVVLHEGTKLERTYSFRYYYLGKPGFVGVADQFTRMVFQEGQRFNGIEFLEETHDLDPNSPLKYIKEMPSWSLQRNNAANETAKKAIETMLGPPPANRKPKLGGKVAISVKPKFVMSKPTFKKPVLKKATFKPKFIKHEDRPDVGYDPFIDEVLKPKAEKPKFKIKTSRFKLRGKQ